MTNQKYELLNESLKAIVEDKINILILVGEAGMSKTYNTISYLKENNINYEYINSYSTPLSFYEILYKNAEKEVVVFDDISSIGNSLIISLLKSACWTFDPRKIISYYSTSKVLEERGLPESFEFKGRVILIFNQELINRGVKINFNFTLKEKLKIFEEVKKDAKIEDEVLEYLKNNCNEATGNLSIRTLVILSTLKNNGYDFKLFAKEILSVDEDVELLRTLNYKEWVEETGKHTATYYRNKEKYGLK